MYKRALTESERIALLHADEADGRVFCTRRGMRDRLVSTGYAKVVADGSRFGVTVITDEGRSTVRRYGSSGGRA